MLSLGYLGGSKLGYMGVGGGGVSIMIDLTPAIVQNVPILILQNSSDSALAFDSHGHISNSSYSRYV